MREREGQAPPTGPSYLHPPPSLIRHVQGRPRTWAQDLSQVGPIAVLLRQHLAPSKHLLKQSEFTSTSSNSQEFSLMSIHMVSGIKNFIQIVKENFKKLFLIARRLCACQTETEEPHGTESEDPPPMGQSHLAVLSPFFHPSGFGACTHMWPGDFSAARVAFELRSVV